MSGSVSSCVRSLRTTCLVLAGVVLVGGIGSGCGSSGVAREGVSMSSSTSENTPVAERQDSTEQEEESQAEAEEANVSEAEPVEVLRLSRVSTRLETAAQDWYGTPYKWGGSSKQGVDCSGFVKNLYREAFDMRLPRVTETQLQTGTKVARDQIRPGDLVFFRPENDYNHVGVYIGDGTFVHASSSEGVRKSPLDRDYWEQYYWTTRRPLKPSRVPDSLTSDLVAYQYPDTTVQATDPPSKTETASTSNEEMPTTDEAETPTTGETSTTDEATAAGETPTPDETTTASAEEDGGTEIASCSDPGVECADPAASGPTASADTTLRKGW